MKSKTDWVKIIGGAIAGIGIANGWEMPSEIGCTICGSKKDLVGSTVLAVFVGRPGETYCGRCCIGIKEIVTATIDGMKIEAQAKRKT